MKYLGYLYFIQIFCEHFKKKGNYNFTGNESYSERKSNSSSMEGVASHPIHPPLPLNPPCTYIHTIPDKHVYTCNLFNRIVVAVVSSERSHFSAKYEITDIHTYNTGQTCWTYIEHVKYLPRWDHVLRRHTKRNMKNWYTADTDNKA